MNGSIEVSDGAGRTLAIILRADAAPVSTSFVTPTELSLQVGFIVYPAAGVVQRHVHQPIERRIVGTPEVLLVRKGRCAVELYDEEREHVVTHELAEGDVILLLAGGHGFEMSEDTVLLEIKQGPYTGIDEKERF